MTWSFWNNIILIIKKVDNWIRNKLCFKKQILDVDHTQTYLIHVQPVSTLNNLFKIWFVINIMGNHPIQNVYKEIEKINSVQYMYSIKICNKYKWLLLNESWRKLCYAKVNLSTIKRLCWNLCLSTCPKQGVPAKSKKCPKSQSTGWRRSWGFKSIFWGRCDKNSKQLFKKHRTPSMKNETHCHNEHYLNKKQIYENYKLATTKKVALPQFFPCCNITSRLPDLYAKAKTWNPKNVPWTAASLKPR